MAKNILYNRITKFLKKEIGFNKEWINKFTVVGFLFFFWVTFIDSHSFLESFRMKRNLKRMNDEKIELIEKIAEAKDHKKDLENNKEKFAREQYYMHREDEEVFIIEKR